MNNNKIQFTIESPWLIQLMNGVHKEIMSDIHRIAEDERLYTEQNFSLRSQAIDDLEFHIIDRIDGLTESMQASDSIAALKQQARRLKHKLEDVDRNMFQRLRSKIAQGHYRGQQLTELIFEYVGLTSGPFSEEGAVGYDDLDLFLNGLLTDMTMPVETKERESEMVFYQKTPGRIILELVKRAGFTPHDVFFDLGSGLGQVGILVNLLASVVSKGVEIEPAFCDYANTCAADLNLNNVSFINTDARDADYSSGTIFFMYTPFGGQMLHDVLHRLKNEAKTRQIKLFSYGPCTAAVAKQDWLNSAMETSPNALIEFISI